MSLDVRSNTITINTCAKFQYNIVKIGKDIMTLRGITLTRKF